MKSARYLLLVMILALAVAFVASAAGLGSAAPDVAADSDTVDLTATFGAEEFHAQLTAIAQDEVHTGP